MQMARTPQTGISLKQLMEFGATVKQGGSMREETLIQAAKFLHHELPVRFAHRISELHNLPHGLAAMPSVQRVASWYEACMLAFLAHHACCTSRATRVNAGMSGLWRT